MWHARISEIGQLPRLWGWKLGTPDFIKRWIAPSVLIFFLDINGACPGFRKKNQFGLFQFEVSFHSRLLCLFKCGLFRFTHIYHSFASLFSTCGGRQWISFFGLCVHFQMEANFFVSLFDRRIDLVSGVVSLVFIFFHFFYWRLSNIDWWFVEQLDYVTCTITVSMRVDLRLSSFLFDKLTFFLSFCLLVSFGFSDFLVLRRTSVDYRFIFHNDILFLFLSFPICFSLFSTCGRHKSTTFFLTKNDILLLLFQSFPPIFSRFFELRRSQVEQNAACDGNVGTVASATELSELSLNCNFGHRKSKKWKKIETNENISEICSWPCGARQLGWSPFATARLCGAPTIPGRYVSW